MVKRRTAVALLCSAALFCACLLCAPACSSGFAADARGDVTILLFRTETVKQIQLHSPVASLRFCPPCAAQRGPVALDLKHQGTGMVDGAGKALRMVELEGEAEVITLGKRRAVAAGRWKIDVAGDGLRIRVQVPRERYVEAVLSAEAGPNEPAESLKALAVVVRSFAVAGQRRHEDGALCDTTHCQALRLGPVPHAIRDAVWSTSSEALWFKSKQVPAYFSEHCGGGSEDAALLWGGPQMPWLTARPDRWCARVPSQWRADLALSDVQRALAAEGFSITGPIQDVIVVSRDRSGRTQQVAVREGAEGHRMSAATLRFALNRSLGWNQLRSDRYQVRRVGDRLLFTGSGLGHGVGLCQAGAAEMARAGKNYREILQVYFPGAVVQIGGEDQGWIDRPQNGLLLRSIKRDSGLEREAAQAFAQARERWGLPVKEAPSLTIFPSTETFRQATGQPGWQLASTQGTRIAVQPAAVLRTYGGAVPVFRHELLHTFVEAVASPTAELWLREGIVAALNGETCRVGVLPSAELVDAGLRRAGSLAQSQQAHAAACVMARRYVAEHGLRDAQERLRHTGTTR